jgi:hypothetical protein
MSVLVEVFDKANQGIPDALSGWENRVDGWCAEYGLAHDPVEISEINIDLAVFLFDHIAERVVLAYALSTRQLMKRDANRMRGFPDVNISVRASLQDRAFATDKGHFLGHASGGTMDINLFPHRCELNRGWSPEGKLFRRMEQYVERHPGTFFYHRPIYDDETWIPSDLEYGVLKDRGTWCEAAFRNK